MEGCAVDTTWADVCPVDEFDVDRGAAALINGVQIAIFRLSTADPEGTSVADEWFAVGNRDPFSGANVLSRGIIGSAGATLYVSSPMHKQRFDLRTGRCLDDEAISIPVFPIRILDGRVLVLVPLSTFSRLHCVRLSDAGF